MNDQAWPALILAEWEDTRATLHMMLQIVGKTRMVLSPHINHWWEVPLYVTARGLTTSPIPYADIIFEVQFDFITHKLEIITSRGTVASILLRPRSVADFYHGFMDTLKAPIPTNFAESRVRPAQAFYSKEFGEFMLKYEDVRLAEDPKAMLLEFFQSTYVAGATLADWDRASLEGCSP